MNKKNWLIVLLVAVVIVAVGIGYAFMKEVKSPAKFDPLNATYTVDGQPAALVNGKAEVPAAPGSASQVTTTVFGQPVAGDLNGDGMTDSAMVISQDAGGSGTFYYVVATINTLNQGAVGTNAVLLGDRIALQNIAIKNGQIVVNYADRAPSDPMTVAPSVGESMYLVVNGTALATTTPVAGAGEHCGGNMTTAASCAAGYHCAPDPASHLPFGDVGGTCVAN